MRILHLPKTWEGWYFWEHYLVDPEGNRYSMDMVRSSLFTLQLSHELRGTTLQVHSLKQELKQRIDHLKQFQEVTIIWGNQTLVIPLKAIRDGLKAAHPSQAHSAAFSPSLLIHHSGRINHTA